MRSSKHFIPMLDRIRNNMIQPIDPVDYGPRKKIKIPSKVRLDVWATYIGEDIAKHKCICCKSAPSFCARNPSKTISLPCSATNCVRP